MTKLRITNFAVLFLICTSLISQQKAIKHHMIAQMHQRKLYESRLLPFQEYVHSFIQHGLFINKTMQRLNIRLHRPPSLLPSPERPMEL
jgi:hypothetical protein